MNGRISENQQNPRFPTKGKPPWLKAKIPSGTDYFYLKKSLNMNKLHTICQSARCPNISECWNNHQATFLIMGEICTRNCLFCAVKKGKPEPLNDSEAQRILQVIKILKLKYVTITSVTRDDLADGGSNYFAKIIQLLKMQISELIIEVLIPDFKGSQNELEEILQETPDVVNHNLETVKRLYSKVNRNPDNYHVSLNLLKYAKKRKFMTKSGIMVGLGETLEEIKELLYNLREQGVDIITIGQYLQPSRENLAVKKYYSPQEFDYLNEIAVKCGFKAVCSGPLIRSSYQAKKLYEMVKNEIPSF